MMSRKKVYFVLGIFLDSETNGLNAKKHQLLEIAYRILDVETGAVLSSFSSLIRLSQEDFSKSDPMSLQINGFTLQELEKGLPIHEVSSKITADFERHQIKRGSSVFICQNPSFDRAFFNQLIDPEVQEKKLWPYHWLDLASMFWAISLLKQGTMPPPWVSGYNKDAIAAFYKLPPETKPHRAMNGVDHLIACYKKVVGFSKSSS